MVGGTHDYLAVVDPYFGYDANGLSVSPNDKVLDIAVSGNTVYVGGRFTSIGGQQRRYLAAMGRSLGGAGSWDPEPDGAVEALATDSGGVYAGGRFTTIASVPRPGLAALDPTSGAALPFAPEVGTSSQNSAPGSPRALEATSDRLIMGGDYYSVGTAAQTGVALFNKYGVMNEPSQGAHTSKRLTLRATAETSVLDRVTFEYRLTDSDPWTQVPANSVTTNRNDPIGSWPKTLSGNSTTLVWDLSAVTIGDPSNNGEKTVQIRAVFTNSSGDTYPTDSMAATYDPRGLAGGSDTEGIGPGSVDLVTGNFAITRDDFSSDSYNSDLTVSRSFNSRNLSASSPIGPGWTTSLPVDAAASDFVRLEQRIDPDYGQVVVITTSDGSELYFDYGADAQYHPEPGLEDLRLTFDGSAFWLYDSDGNQTKFEPGGGAFVPTQILQPGTDNNTTYTYRGDGKVSQIFAPGASNVNCSPPPDDKYRKKCRYLTLSYRGDGRLDYIEYTAWDPDTSSPRTTRVAQYGYDGSGRLSSAWDPRIEPAPGSFLKETYTYDADGRLATVKPPGLNPWTMTYQALPGEVWSTGRLRAVSRTALEGTATTTVVYHVPLGGSGGPYGLNPSDVEQWGQADFPTDATAIFPPDHVPQSDPPSSYTGATIHYMDAKAREVNVATPNGGISTTEYDSHDNVVRKLSASNRAEALAPPASGSCSNADSVTRSRLYDSESTYSSDGVELREELGPLHWLKLGGATSATCARSHHTIAYDQGLLDTDFLPEGQPLHLPTTESVGAQVPGQQSDSDVRTTTYGYNQDVRGQTLPVGQWFRKPTTVTTAGRTSTTLYDEDTGLPTETRMPMNPNGGDAHATKTVYYSNTPNGTYPECGNKAEWEHLPCKTFPAVQPGTPNLPGLPTTTYQYDWEYRSTIARDNVGGTDRTTTLGYDAAGRLTSQAVSSPEGTSVPTSHLQYDPTTGLPARTYEDGSTREITRTYDVLGRLKAYKDADGSISTTTYDASGRPRTLSDAKGSRTLVYDDSTELLKEIDDPFVGTFSATYDPDGRVAAQGYPGGLQSQTTYDESGSAVHLRYVKGASTLLDFAATENVHGQVVTQTGTLSSQEYTYDSLGRLTQVNDTPHGQACTKRTYSYDDDSNRTSMTRGGDCGSSATGPSTGYSYDAADRLKNSGVTYDQLGRITHLPTALAGGGDLTTSYYVNDLVHSQTQDGVTNTYALDPAGRQRQRVTETASETDTEIYHYATDSDSPAWIDASDSFGNSSWTRMVCGIDGSLAAIQHDNGQIDLQLANLHGDVVATMHPAASALSDSFEADEFGVPMQESSPKYSWLGTMRRRTELKSGVVQMGVRSYVPGIGRFLETDPVPGGSANAYDYANQDPVDQYDVDGKLVKKTSCTVGGLIKRSKNKHRLSVLAAVSCAGTVTLEAKFVWKRLIGFNGGGSVTLATHRKPTVVASGFPYTDSFEGGPIGKRYVDFCYRATPVGATPGTEQPNGRAPGKWSCVALGLSKKFFGLVRTGL